MARIPYPDPDTIPESVKAAMEGTAPYNIFKMLPHATTQVHGFLRFGTANFTQIDLDPRLREVAILATARATNANYEWAHHVTIAKRTGVSDEEIEAIKAGHLGLLRPDDRTIAEFATSVSKDVRASDETFAAARNLLGTQQVVELLLLVGYYNLVARFLETLEVDLEDKYVNRLR